MFIDPNDPQLESKLRAESQENERLLSVGEEAPAKILTLTDTGIKLGDHTSLLEFYVEVFPDELPPFNVATHHVVADEDRARYEPGLTIYVKFDPGFPKAVAVDHTSVE